MKKIFLIALFALGAVWPVIVFFMFEPIALRDFGGWWVAGHAIRLGIDPYDLIAFKALGDKILGVANYNFTYPPHILFLLFPLSFLSPMAALILWNVGSAVLFWWAARPWIPKGMPSILAILTPGALVNVNYGQTGLICSALFLMAFRGSGIAAALLTIKPHFGFLVFPAMLRDKRAFAVAASATFALIVVSGMVFGGWLEFFAHARDVQSTKVWDLSQAIWMVKGTTPAIGYGFWGWIIFAVAGVFFLSRNYNVFTAATATFLISPYGLHYDMAALCLGFAILLYTKWEVLPLDEKIAAVLAFLTPVIVVFLMTWAISPILLWGLLVQVKRTEGIRLHVQLGGPNGRRPEFRLQPATSSLR